MLNNTFKKEDNMKALGKFLMEFETDPLQFSAEEDVEVDMLPRFGVP